MPRGKRGGLSKASYPGGLPLPYPPTLPIDTPISVAGRGRQGVLIGGTTQRPRDQLRGGLLSAFAPTNGRDEVSPTQTPSAPTRSEEAHRVGAGRRAILSRDGLTLTRRRPSRREMRACGASSRKRPRRPGVAQAVADGVNSQRGSLQVLQLSTSQFANNSNSQLRINPKRFFKKNQSTTPTTKRNEVIKSHLNQAGIFSS